MALVSRKVRRQKRHFRARRKLVGTQDRPRLSVYRSNKHISAQIVVDSDPENPSKGAITLCATSSYSSKLKPELNGGANVAAAELVGKTVAELAKEKGISKVVFDKGGNLYHGRVKALAEAAREAGLEF
ncbi:MAG: 50S ribosomal protein L18 [Candidatus Caenarcaniphilales bacterium]|nr:50S ribosomal protein L18 [Candidatus Caenarcaniphilales bacterium]